MESSAVLKNKLEKLYKITSNPHIKSMLNKIDKRFADKYTQAAKILDSNYGSKIMDIQDKMGKIPNPQTSIAYTRLHGKTNALRNELTKKLKDLQLATDESRDAMKKFFLNRTDELKDNAKAMYKQYRGALNVEKAGGTVGQKTEKFLRKTFSLNGQKAKILAGAGIAGSLATGAAYARYKQLERERQKKGIRKESMKLWEQYFIE